MSSASGKMPLEVIFPMEFLSLFQDNIAPFALVCTVCGKYEIRVLSTCTANQKF